MNFTCTFLQEMKTVLKYLLKDHQCRGQKKVNNFTKMFILLTNQILTADWLRQEIDRTREYDAV